MKITGFHQDADSIWVAELDCGHDQHIRHNPPWTNRPWVLTEEGRNGFLGHTLACTRCPAAAMTSATASSAAVPGSGVGESRICAV